VKGPASESLRRRNPREAGGQLAVYGDLARQQRCREMVRLGIAEGCKPLMIADWLLLAYSTGRLRAGG